MIHPEFPELGDVVYLEHAHRGPLPERSRRAVVDALALAARGVSGKTALQDAAAEGCGRLPGLLGVVSTTLHFTQNTTSGLAEVAAGIDWRPGDRVVTTEAEWPSAIDVWRRPGVQVDVLPVRKKDDRIDHDLLRHAMKGARVVSLGAVCLATGERRDLGLYSGMAHREGA
ncbi:MAG: aminotransferase class V-fold PLP-dependent enzyme, partial [Planctomycetota bacterium]